MNFYEFFSMLASEVTDDISQADIIVSDFNVNAAECVEIIRSCDFERMISLMNAEQRVRERTLAPSAVATATSSLRASVHP